MRSAEDFEYSVFAMQAIKRDENDFIYIDHDLLVKELKAWKEEIYWHGYVAIRDQAIDECIKSFPMTFGMDLLNYRDFAVEKMKALKTTGESK